MLPACVGCVKLDDGASGGRVGAGLPEWLILYTAPINNSLITQCF